MVYHIIHFCHTRNLITIIFQSDKYRSKIFQSHSQKRNKKSRTDWCWNIDEIFISIFFLRWPCWKLKISCRKENIRIWELGNIISWRAACVLSLCVYCSKIKITKNKTSFTDWLMGGQDECELLFSVLLAHWIDMSLKCLHINLSNEKYLFEPIIIYSRSFIFYV